MRSQRASGRQEPTPVRLPAREPQRMAFAALPVILVRVMPSSLAFAPPGRTRRIMETKKLYDEYLITSMVPDFDPVEVESALGATVHCASGKEYLDRFSGITVRSRR
jgi:hypothetical protein